MTGVAAAAPRTEDSPTAEAASEQAARGWRAGLAAATVIGAVLALHGLGHSAFDFDEAYSLHFIQWPWTHMLTIDHGNQGLYYALLKAWHGAFTSEAGVRLLSWVPFVATIPAAALLATRLFGRRVALVSAFLVATHPLLIRYAQNARGYAWAVFVFTAGAALLVAGIQDQRARPFWAGVVLLGVAVHLHSVTGFGSVSLLAWMWWLPRERVPASRPLAAAAYGLVVAPFLVVAGRAGPTQIQWANTYGSVAEGPLYQLPGGTPASLVLGLLAVGGGVWATSRILRSPRTIDSWSAGVPVVIVLGTVLIAAVAVFEQSFFVPRFLLFLVVPLAILAGTSVRWFPWPKAAMTLLVVVVLCHGFVSATRERHEPWRDLDQVLTREAQPGDALVALPTSVLAPLDVYHGQHAGDPPYPAVPAFRWTQRSMAHSGRQLPAVSSAPPLPARVWVLVPAEETAGQADYLRTDLAGRTLVREERFDDRRLELWAPP